MGRVRPALVRGFDETMREIVSRVFDRRTRSARKNAQRRHPHDRQPPQAQARALRSLNQWTRDRHKMTTGIALEPVIHWMVPAHVCEEGQS